MAFITKSKEAACCSMQTCCSMQKRKARNAGRSGLSGAADAPFRGATECIHHTRHGKRAAFGSFQTAIARSHATREAGRPFFGAGFTYENARHTFVGDNDKG